MWVEDCFVRNVSCCSFKRHVAYDYVAHKVITWILFYVLIASVFALVQLTCPDVDTSLFSFGGKCRLLQLHTLYTLSQALSVKAHSIVIYRFSKQHTYCICNLTIGVILGINNLLSIICIQYISAYSICTVM